MHWADGDTGIRHFAGRVNPDSDAYTDESVKRMCVVLDLPSGCGLKACIGIDCLPNNPEFLHTGIQYFQMRSYDMAVEDTPDHWRTLPAGAWPPTANTFGLYTSPFGDPVKDLADATFGDEGAVYGPQTGFLFPYAPRLEMTVIIDAEASDDEDLDP